MIVFLDLDGTLVDHAGAVRSATRAFYREHGALFARIGEERFWRDWHELAEQYAQRANDGEVSWSDQRRLRLKEVFRWVGRELSDEQADLEFGRYLRHYEGNWRLFPDVAPCLDGLAHVRLGVITNGDAPQQEQKLIALGIRGRFDPLVISTAIGVSKPDPAVFRRASLLAGSAPADCIHVGDRLEDDARAAAAVGMHGVWLDRTGRAGQIGGVRVIHTLTELPPLVRAVRGQRRPEG